MIHNNKLDLNKFNKILGAIVIFTAPIDRYLLEIPFVINLSFYRLFLLLLIVIFIIQKINNPKLYGNKNFYWLISFYLIGMFIGISQSNRLGDFSSYFFNEFMGLSLLVIFVNIYDKNDLDKLIKVFLSSFIFPILISIYVYYVFATQLRIVDVLPLSDILPLHKTIEVDTRAFRAGLFPRLGLPYSTSPHLAVVASIFLFIVAFYYKKTKKFILIAPILIIMIGTLTRTVVVSTIATIIIYFIIYMHDKGINIIKVKKSTIIVLFGIIILFVIILNTAAFDVLLQRTYVTNISESRHFLLIFEAFFIMFESFKNLLFGIGDGNIVFREGVYTYLPPDGILNSHLTVFIHRGFLGFIFTISLYIYLLINLFNKRDSYDRISYAFLISFINVLIAFTFYELRYVNGVWILMALIAIYTNHKNLNKNLISN